MTAEQSCEGRDEFTNGSPREQWVWGKEVGWGEGLTVYAGCRGYQGLVRVNSAFVVMPK